jgi:hypothetical protein
MCSGSCFAMPTFNFTGSSSFVAPTIGNYYNFSGVPSSNSFLNFGVYNTYDFTGTSDSVVENNIVSNVEPLAETQKINSSNNEVKSQSFVPNPNKNVNIGKSFISNASKYLGYSENSGQSKLFSSSPEWCADFVTYVVKESYKEKGLTVPEDFGSHRVEILKQWGIKNGKYLSLIDKEDKSATIKNSVKVGDILILRENGASHTGFVSKINKDGSFDTIEGNVSEGGDDKVVKNHYSPYYKDISGFVQLS